MSEVIEVKDVPGLGTYSVSISSYAEAVQSAGDQTQRNFTDKIQGSHADAIQAFLSRLNTIQSQVFDQVPETLKKYSTIVSTFEGTVKGAGFTSRAKTSGDGVSSVASKIETDQITEIETTKTSLKSALDKAAEVLGVESPDVVTPTTTATTELTQSVTNRKTAHQQLDQGNTAFKSELENIKATLEVYIRIVQNAKAFASANATYLFDQIKQGHLTAENMYYTALIQNDADIEVMKLIIEGRPQDVGQIRDKEVTSGGYRILGDGVMKWIETGEFAEYNEDGSVKKTGKIQIFFDALGKTPQSKTQNILKNMLFAGDEHAADVTTLQEIEYAQNGNRFDTATMVALNNEMRAVNRYNGLLKTLIYLNYGQIKQKVSTDSNQEIDVNDFVQISEADIDNIKVRHYNLIGSMKGNRLPPGTSEDGWRTVYTSELDTSYSGYANTQVEARLTALEVERQEAKVTYIKSVLTSLLTVGVAAANMFTPLPGLTALAAVASKVILSRPVQAGIGAVDESGFQFFQTGKHQNPELAKLAHNQGVNSLTAMVDLLTAHRNYEVKKQKLDKEEIMALKDLRKSITGGGGWSLSANEKVITTSADNYHDFRMHKRIQELDKQGVTQYLEKHHISPETYRGILQDKGISEEIQNYLLGVDADPEKGKVSIEQMNHSQLKELRDGMRYVSLADPTDTNKMVDGFESITNDLNNRYNPESGK